MLKINPSDPSVKDYVHVKIGCRIIYSSGYDTVDLNEYSLST